MAPPFLTIEDFPEVIDEGHWLEQGMKERRGIDADYDMMELF
jgi:hypothetical protein